jgi:DNA primase
MGLFPQPFLDDLRLQAGILQIVQDYVPLRRSGTTYKGLCPFHAEKTPSFHVNPEKGFFHCFGCGAGGDVFKFLELHEKIAFPEAVRMLAHRCGLPLPDTGEGQSEDVRRDARLREELLRIHDAAAAYFREQLEGPAGARARQQLNERRLTPETVARLGLGFAPSSREGLASTLLARGFPASLMVQSGLVVAREQGALVDRFRGRLMVPICRDTGAVVAFGGRSIDPDRQPKYLNSPETPIYSKGRSLYGLHLTRAAIRSLGYAVIVEGYFDFAQVFQALAAPVVASCGTALTPQQARLLRRFTSKVVLSYDPDAAGQSAAARSCELLVGEGFDVNVAMLDGGEDPDTFIRRRGGEGYRERLRSSRPYLEYLLEQAASGLDFAQEEPRRQFLTRMLAVAARIPDAAARDQFADRLAHRARITEEVVRAEIRKAAAARKPVLTNELPSTGPLKDAERALIWWIINRPTEAYPELAALEPEDLEQLNSRPILEVARALPPGQPADLLPTLIGRLSTVEERLVTRIAAEPRPPAFQVADCVRALKRVRWERAHSAVRHEIDRLQQLGRDGTEMDALLVQMRELAHQIEGLR